MKVHVCRGKDCRTHGGTTKICALLDAAGVPYSAVRCQKVCKAPVVGVELDGKLSWYRKLRGKEARKRLLAVIERGKTKKLKKHAVRKRAGKLR